MLSVSLGSSVTRHVESVLSPLEAVNLVVMILMGHDGSSHQHVVFSTPDVQECENISEFLTVTVQPDKKADFTVQYVCTKGPLQ